MSRKRIGLKSMSVLLSAVIIATVAGSLNVSAKTPQEYQQEIDKLDEKLNSLKDNEGKENQYQKTLDTQITVLNESLTSYQQQIDSLNADIAGRNEKIAGLETQINAKQVEIETKTAEMASKEAEKDETIRLLKERIRASYMSGQTTVIDALLSADDFGEFLTRMEYTKRIVSHDRELMDKLEQQQKEIEAVRTQLENAKAQNQKDKTDQQKQIGEVEVKRTELVTQQQEQQATADTVNQKLLESKNKINQISQEYAAAQNEKNRIEKDYRLQQEAIDKVVNENTGDNNDTGNIPSESGFIWPLPGHSYISSPYGYRTGTFSGFHTGIDIPAPAGTSIVAAKSGRVTAAYHNETPSYGKYVMISHDDGTSTLYAHCSVLDVNVGDIVSQGQRIAGVGSTGDSTGNHLHFEVYVNSSRQNPEDYV